MIPQFIEKRVFFPFVPYKLSQLEESDHQRYQWKPLQIQAHSKIQKGWWLHLNKPSVEKKSKLKENTLNIPNPLHSLA